MLDYTFLDDYGLKKVTPTSVKKFVGSLLSNSGNELFYNEQQKDMSESLLYRMATTEEFLAPLRLFSARRLYANLKNDFVVPLGTAAFIASETVQELRKKYKDDTGIVTIISTPRESEVQPVESRNDYLESMIQHLNSCGWEKIVVHFPLTFGLFPFAHNKICALAPGPRYHPLITNTLLRFTDGEIVMDNATAWLTKE